MLKDMEKQAEELGIKIEKRSIKKEEYYAHEHEAEIFTFECEGEIYRIEISHFDWYTDMCIRYEPPPPTA